MTTVAILTLALGIGANTAIFSLMNAVILRTLPVHDPQQLVSISAISPSDRRLEDTLSVPLFEEIRRHQEVFSEMFLWVDRGTTNIEANGARYADNVELVDGAYYSTLGIKPLLGRLIGPDDVALSSGSSARVAVISYHCWQNRYNGDPSVIGKTIQVDAVPLTIIGVTPKSFHGLIIDVSPSATVPLGFSGGTAFRARESLWLNGIGRLKRGVTIEQAQAHLETLWPGVLEASAPSGYQSKNREDFFGRRASVTSAATGDSFLRRRFSRPLTVLMAVVGLVLLIACVNLANLMLARAAGRQREIGIRIALGASRGRLIRQLLAESMILSAAGAALGSVFALWAGRPLLDLVWVGLAMNTAPDLRVLAFTAGVAALTGVLFGLAPALRTSQGRPASALQQQARTVHGSGDSLSKFLVTGQVALSLVLVIGAASFVRSLENLQTVDLGYRRDGVLFLQLFPQSGSGKIPNRNVYYRELAERLAGLPGVQSMSYSNIGPATGGEFDMRVSQMLSEDPKVGAAMDFVGPGFFNLVEVSVLEGREFGWSDDESAPPVAIISENLAQRLFGDGNALGQRIDIDRFPTANGREIVGVVRTAGLWTAKNTTPAAVYIPFLQEPTVNQPTALIRAGGDLSALAPPARRAMERMGYHYPLLEGVLEDRFLKSLGSERLTATLASFFGVLALLLASVGLYGLMSYAVSRRTSEIGLRMALGARRETVLAMILRDALRLVAAGIVAGVPIALAGSHLVSGMLFGLSDSKLEVITLAVAILVSVALFAAYLPARRASRIEPMTALRSE